MRLKSVLICAVGLYLFAANQVVVAAPPQDRCALPAGLHDEITKKYPGASLVILADLSEIQWENCFRKTTVLDARVL